MAAGYRYALVAYGMESDHAKARKAVGAYMPANYHVLKETEKGIVIRGLDRAGWTLDDYVLPRLGSGLWFGEEITEETARAMTTKAVLPA